MPETIEESDLATVVKNSGHDRISILKIDIDIDGGEAAVFGSHL